MSGNGNCWDNAVTESFEKIFKSELVYGTKLKTREQMRLYVFEYIEPWYNLIYRLDAMEAYNKKLAKKIAMKGIAQTGTTKYFLYSLLIHRNIL